MVVHKTTYPDAQGCSCDCVDFGQNG